MFQEDRDISLVDIWVESQETGVRMPNILVEVSYGWSTEGTNRRKGSHDIRVELGGQIQQLCTTLGTLWLSLCRVSRRDMTWPNSHFKRILWLSCQLLWGWGQEPGGQLGGSCWDTDKRCWFGLWWIDGERSNRVLDMFWRSKDLLANWTGV